MLVTVRKGCVVLKVEEDFLPHYLSRGYDKIDEKTGSVTQKGMTNNFNSLQLAYAELNKENQKNLIENQKLKNRIKELEKKLEQLEKKSSTKTTNK